MRPFFSIIMACCDVEPYIREAVESVTKQSFGDWECICGIEDSKDRTEEILREMASSDPRIRIFNHPRSGSCSAARNVGTDMAQGEYVIFLDGDDTIADGSLARIHDMIAARPGADLYPCEIVAYTEGTDKREIRENYPPDSSPEEMTGPEATALLNRLWNGRFCPMLQMTVFRREYLIERDLKCIYGLRRQDSEFSPRALYCAKRVVPLHEPFYLYRMHANSVSSAGEKAGYFLGDWAIILRSLMAFHARISKEPGYDRGISVCWAYQWERRIVYFWFSPDNLRAIPREKRVESLSVLFENGTRDFDLLAQYVPYSTRVAMNWIRLFVKYPACRGMIEILFKLHSALFSGHVKDAESIRA